ncbi:hypothetical protein SAMN05216360_12511 [Methylobacterium phyllostachyos]|uniref:Uncharacterized protein n=1 Tax=Methylobacterium phyllostachyos TaxID=582672 RepID=A0A1H0K6B8_9HYPH|nr:hypothetical protein [Methylobacterium phyllostachyos]SDO51290.1 hypothetical protein SAMN05216360_12511 [Methylobacterium phyllostachyos]
MRTEKKIETQVRKEREEAGKVSDRDAREFANEVFSALNEMAAHEAVQGHSASEAERLAAVFTFLRTLTLEYMRQVRNYPETVGAEQERMRVAMEAFIMLRDVARPRRHPVHKFFRGAGQRLQPRQPTSREMGRDCILFAAIGALVAAGAQQEMRPAAAIRLLKGRPGINKHIQQSEEALAKALSRKEIEPEYADDIADYRAMMSWAGDLSTEGILAWAEMALNSRENPLDRAAATTIKQLGMVRHASDGSAVLMRPRPPRVPALPSQRTISAIPAAQTAGAKRLPS